MKRRTYQCTFCKCKVTCIGTVQGHHCPANKSKWVPTKKWALLDETTVRAPQQSNGRMKLTTAAQEELMGLVADAERDIAALRRSLS